MRMSRARFAALRPWLFVRGLAVRRNRPDLERLRRIRDPERFVWAVLPHAARTFAPSIVGLPYRRAVAAAVAYLYARMLDTYEDLAVGAAAKTEGLAGFRDRFEVTPPSPPPVLRSPAVGDDRDRLHVLLLERCGAVDEVFAGLAPSDREHIIDMLGAMSTGMQRFAELFERGGGVLTSRDDVDEYCHSVIGHPIAFTMRLLLDESAAARHRKDAMDISILLQLANITRDIEKDARRGVGYHPALSAELGRPEPDPETVARARADLVGRGLRHVPAYRRLISDLDLPRFSLARGSAVLMALYTDRHYREMARRCAIGDWGGIDSSAGIWASALTSIVAPRWAGHTLERIERTVAARPAATTEAVDR